MNLTTHHHDLNLTFSPPYHNKIFSCDICKNMGSKEWLYRCNMCDFDAHMVCDTATCTGTATKAIRLPPIPQQEAPSVYNYHGIGFLHNHGLRSISLNSNPSSSSAGHGRGSSDQQVLRFLANATILGLGVLMHGRRLSGIGSSSSGSGGESLALTDCGIAIGGGDGDASLSSFNVDFGLGDMDFGGRQY